MHALLISLLAAAPTVALSSPSEGVTTAAFTDGQGEHRVTVTIGKVKETDAGKSQRLTALHELRANAKAPWKKIWDAKDFENDCPYDLSLVFDPKDLLVSDVDDNGTAEIAFAYQLGCRSDVSPLTMKLLVYEGTAKYALRGTAKTRVGEHEFMGGDFKPDPAFGKAPKGLLEHAQQLWTRVNARAE